MAESLEILIATTWSSTRCRRSAALQSDALGVIRMLVERELPIDLGELIEIAVPDFGAAIHDPTAPLSDFVYERLTNSLRDGEYSPQEIAAVVSLRPARLAEVPRRLAAVLERSVAGARDAGLVVVSTFARVNAL